MISKSLQHSNNIFAKLMRECILEKYIRMLKQCFETFLAMIGGSLKSNVDSTIHHNIAIIHCREK